MPDLHSIENALLTTGWNKARVRLLARFLIALIVCRTVCLYRLANFLPGKAQTGSHYKRLQRFLSGFSLDFAGLARLIVDWTRLKPPFVLAMDRTNWKLGRVEINFLVLALVHNGVAFPLFWTVLGKAGNSRLSERARLLNQYLAIFGKDSISYLCADREFGGACFCDWLLAQKIPFVLRLRGNVITTNASRQKCAVQDLFWQGKMYEARALGKRRVFGKGLALFVSGMRISGGDFVICVSDTAEGLLERYEKRWGIETLFGCLKRRGFNLEATHLVEPERLARLLGVLALAFCWAYISGAWLFEQKPWKIKKHGRLMVSLFRRGVDWLQRLLLPLCGNYSQEGFEKARQFLSCT